MAHVHGQQAASDWRHEAFLHGIAQHNTAAKPSLGLGKLPASCPMYILHVMQSPISSSSSHSQKPTTSCSYKRLPAMTTHHRIYAKKMNLFQATDTFQCFLLMLVPFKAMKLVSATSTRSFMCVLMAYKQWACNSLKILEKQHVVSLYMVYIMYDG